MLRLCRGRILARFFDLRGLRCRGLAFGRGHGRGHDGLHSDGVAIDPVVHIGAEAQRPPPLAVLFLHFHGEERRVIDAEE